MARILYRLFAALITCWLLWVNIAVHSVPRVGKEEELVELRAQLCFLEDRVYAGLGGEMQALFPEGSVFTHALYGAAWCGYAQRIGSDSIRDHALHEARWALAQIERSDVQGLFPVAAEPKFGAFYCGWRNYLLASIVKLGASQQAETDVLERYSAELDSAFAKSDSPYMESYSGMAWPADNVVAMASLAMHQSVSPGAHNAVITRWLGQVRKSLDERGMVPHGWDPYSDRQQEHARGCSQALINAFLPMIDSALAHEQFALFQQYFFMERFGVPLVREYPKGITGWGDVDSGPVILGAGCAATIVGSAACRLNGDGFHAQEFDATIEGFGLVVGGEHKRYVLGALPIADLFIAWSRSIPASDVVRSTILFKRFHSWSVLGLLVLWSPWWVGVLRRRYVSRAVNGA